MIAWAIRRRPNSFLQFEVRPHAEQPDGTWREMRAAMLATSKDSAYALLPVGLLLLFASDQAEWWVPWWAPSWWWPNGTKPLSMWDAPPVRAHVIAGW